MPFVAGYNHDLFISYAHVNDLPPRRGVQQGWVEMLVYDIKFELAQKIGRLEGFSVCFDKESMRGHDILSDTIAAQVKASALFVAIRSPAYHASLWCRDEAKLFAQHFAANLINRIFVVEKDPLDADAHPIPQLDGFRAYPFWYRSNLTGPSMPLTLPMTAEEEIDYSRRVRTLVAEIYSQLKAMGGSIHQTRTPAWRPLTGTPPNSALPIILLNAEAHHRDLSDEIRKGIGDRAIWVEPRFEGTAGQIREDFERTLDDCTAMVTVYADNESWARSQLLAAHRLAARNPERKIPVVDAPPRDKPRLGVHNMPNMEIIDARNGIGPDVLSRLESCLGL